MGGVTSTEVDVAVLGSDPLACGIARDAVGRGLRVALLCEEDVSGSFAQQILLEGLLISQNQASVPDTEQSILHRIAPQLGFTEEDLNTEPGARRTLGPMTAHRFAMLSARDAADRGALVRTRCGPVRYTELGTGWHVKAGETDSYFSKLVVDVRPVHTVESGGANARVGIFNGSLPDNSRSPSKTGSTQVLYNLGSSFVAALLTSAGEITEQDLRDVAASENIKSQPLWISDLFFQPDFSRQFEMSQSPPLFRAFDAGDFNWRKRSEDIVAEMAPFVQMIGKPWTQFAKLPGGDFQTGITRQIFEEMQKAYPGIETRYLIRLFSSYGTEIPKVLGSPKSNAMHFGHGLSEPEVAWLVQKEWARTAEDILWRRTHLGLCFSSEQVAALEHWLADNSGIVQSR